jgi:hypothetical protein
LQQWQELLRDQEMRQMIDAPVLLVPFTCSPGKKAGLPDHVIKHKVSFQFRPWGRILTHRFAVL